MRVDFYIVSNVIGVCCQLAERAFLKGMRVRIHTNDIVQSDRIDQSLWTFRSESFIPHVVGESTLVADVPVVIDHIDSSDCTDVLINLADTRPAFYTQYRFICELVAPDTKAAGRVRYKQYEKDGCELHVHDK